LGEGRSSYQQDVPFFPLFMATLHAESPGRGRPTTVWREMGVRAALRLWVCTIWADGGSRGRRRKLRWTIVGSGDITGR